MTDKQQEMVIKIKGDTSQFKDAIQEAIAAVKELEQACKDCEQAVLINIRALIKQELLRAENNE